MTLKFYSPGYQEALLYKEANTCQYPVAAWGPVMTKDLDGKTITTKSDQDVTLMLGTTRTSVLSVNICRINITFKPVSGQAYLAEYRLTGDFCQVRLAVLGQEAKPDSALGRDIPVTFRKYVVPFSGSGSFCGEQLAK